MKKRKQNPQFAVVLTELVKPTNCCTVVNEKGEKFQRYHSFKIGDIVKATKEKGNFMGKDYDQYLRKQDFELLP